MARTAGFKVVGLNAVVRDLQALGLEIDDLKAAFSTIAAEAAQVAAGFAPKRSGRLAGDVRGNRAKSKAVVTAGRVSVPYAGPINYGWGNLGSGWKHGKYATGIRGQYPGNPFMQKTDEVMQPVAIVRLEAEINRQIAKRGLR